MKFYDLEWLAKKCGTDNKYEITAKIAAEARRESEEELNEKDKDNPSNELFISKVLSEIENDTSPISVDYVPPKVEAGAPLAPVQEFEQTPDEPKPELQTYSAAPDETTEEETEEIETETEAETETSNE